MANKTYLKPDAEYVSFYSEEEIMAGGVDGSVVAGNGDANIGGEIVDGGRD